MPNHAPSPSTALVWANDDIDYLRGWGREDDEFSVEETLRDAIRLINYASWRTHHASV